MLPEVINYMCLRISSMHIMFKSENSKHRKSQVILSRFNTKNMANEKKKN